MAQPLILASGSPRRAQLLRELGLAYEVLIAPVLELDGEARPRLEPARLALANARLKAQVVAVAQPGRWVLGADTVVAVDTRVHRRVSADEITLAETHRTESRILGKPCDLGQAREFLTLLSARVHDVITACVLIGPEGSEHELAEVSRVTFRPLSSDDITRYLAAVNVLDKAGAYALQEHGDWIVERVEGSSTNVIGLPVERLRGLLEAQGILTRPEAAA